ncbi:glycoside hydrolase family 13 protein [Herbiconiux sp. KACC 21604]|uniref:glycoside hydrolase family 13 protein n=1 Tax=unclassified Herbiconiux TaxID=2618217 RepID=UPI001492C497|nr:glycoside hydrolase family 13 protein [Herbiconiux sp. SALV-R1]QJU55167.1 glycoside hydrolase family 13 protein [Herbiconiux sp. SALV-R1]WPO86324.1 glycoside hydrolase family 13 protein [Herbiconiux sp. KACC 21604]
MTISAPTTARTDDRLEESAWWRTAVIYQVYPRSFADSNGDGIGDLAGITRRLEHLADLGVDAVWLSPFFTSPQNDGGYDVADYCDVDPLFGTLDDFDEMLAEAHRHGLRVIIDIVPNHSSDQHPWFQRALASPPGSAARDRYLFRAGRGPDGSLPPSNWQSTFGGPAWSRLPDGDWYLHIFDSTQPDLNWRNPAVRADFVDILRFWLDRGVDGFRVDVAHGMIKAEDFPDYHPQELLPLVGVDPTVGLTKEGPNPPYMLQEGLHEIWREWRAVLDEYDGDRVLCAEAWVEPLQRLADWVRPDEMHQAFNFSYLETPWEAPALRTVIDDSITSFESVGAPSTWVLSNHDVIRHASRLGLVTPVPQGEGLGPRTAPLVDPELGARRARAASLLMLALPGSAYLYQGEELGLPEAVDLPDEARRDPSWFRTAGEKYGRDGCRVPIPWEAEAPAFGFSPSGASWLPQPVAWAPLARDRQRGRAGSTLELYRAALALRRRHRLAQGSIRWLSAPGDELLMLRNNGVRVVANLGGEAVALPPQRVLATSAAPGDASAGAVIPPDTTVWLEEDA